MDRLTDTLESFEKSADCPKCGETVTVNALQAITRAGISCPSCQHHFGLLISQRERNVLIREGILHSSQAQD